MNRPPARCAMLRRRRAAARAILVVALAALPIAGCDFGARGRSREIADHEHAATGAPPTPADGAMRFLFDDFGGLSTDTLEASAVPWKLAATALVLHSHPGEAPTQARLQARLQRFGLFVPTSVGNWPEATPPVFRMPMGLVAGPVARRLPAIELEVATIGCASCHAGALYDGAGRPTRDAWLEIGRAHV